MSAIDDHFDSLYHPDFDDEGWDDDGSDSILLLGGPFDGEHHRLQALCPSKIGLPIDEGRMAWYRIDEASATGVFEGVALRRGCG